MTSTNLQAMFFYSLLSFQFQLLPLWVYFLLRQFLLSRILTKLNTKFFIHSIFWFLHSLNQLNDPISSYPFLGQLHYPLLYMLFFWSQQFLTSSLHYTLQPISKSYSTNSILLKLSEPFSITHRLLPSWLHITFIIFHVIFQHLSYIYKLCYNYREFFQMLFAS